MVEKMHHVFYAVLDFEFEILIIIDRCISCIDGLANFLNDGDVMAMMPPALASIGIQY